MSGFETIAPMVMGGLGVANSIGQATAQQSATEAQAAAAERQNQLILQRQAQEDQRQRNLLDQAAASQRAHLGALGVDGNGGSADAILAGMAESSAADINAADQMAQLRTRPVQGQDNLLSGALGKSGLSVFQSFYDQMG